MRLTQEISIFNPLAIKKAVLELNTSITQTAERIELQAQEIAVVNGKIETTTATLDVMAQEISAEVTARQNGDNALSARITVNAQAITSKVSSGDVVSVINQSSQKIALSANRISIESTYFTLNDDGQITATKGIIGNSSASSANKWTIGGNTSRAWIYSGSKSTFNSRTTAGTYIGTDGISMRGTESGTNNFLELKDGIVKATCLRVYDGGGSNSANILLNDEHQVSIPYGISTGDANNPRINYFKNTTYCKGDLVLAGELECAANKTTNVVSEDNEGGGQMRFRNSGSGGLNYVQFDCPVRSENGTEFTSDRRKKEEIEYLNKEKTRDFVMKLKPSSFVFKSDSEKRLHHGFIAQDVVNLVSEHNPYVSAYKDEDDGEFYYYIAYMEFIADLIATVQLQQQEINELKGVING